MVIPGAASPWRSTWTFPLDTPAESLPDIDLHYRYFAAGVSLKMSGIDLIGPDQYVPLVDFLLLIARAIRRLGSDQDAGISFTENANVIRLLNRGSDVIVEAPHRSLTLTVSRQLLLDEFTEFLRAARIRLLQEVPGLVGHPLVISLAGSASLDKAP
jgi:hypothetical protein